jgi:hypothetical protein
MIIFSSNAFSNVCLVSGAGLFVSFAATKFPAIIAGGFPIGIALVVLGLLGKCYQANVIGNIRFLCNFLQAIKANNDHLFKQNL